MSKVMTFWVKTESSDSFHWSTVGDWDPDQCAEHLIDQMEEEVGYIYDCQVSCLDTETDTSDYRSVNFQLIRDWCRENEVGYVE